MAVGFAVVTSSAASLHWPPRVDCRRPPRCEPPTKGSSKTTSHDLPSPSRRTMVPVAPKGTMPVVRAYTTRLPMAYFWSRAGSGTATTEPSAARAAGMWIWRPRTRRSLSSCVGRGVVASSDASKARTTSLVKASSVALIMGMLCTPLASSHSTIIFCTASASLSAHGPVSTCDMSKDRWLCPPATMRCTSGRNFWQYSAMIWKASPEKNQWPLSAPAAAEALSAGALVLLPPLPPLWPFSLPASSR
mmetsp:Transcript_27521/g.85310  ORF Transcript_27521/g.85310 Transcript_27521/m.85310 type:complete len:247 (+) Transcript_27521:891-1631(+)